MFDVAHFTLAFAAGILLGLCYFGGLWWTVRRLSRTRHAWRIYVGSLFLRLALILPSFYLVLTNYGWQPLVVCLLGFVATRLVLIHVIGRVHPALGNGQVA